MNNKLRVILLGGLLLGALVLSMSAVPGAFAAVSTSSTSSSAVVVSNSLGIDAVTLPQPGTPYTKGYRDGYRAGFQDGLNDCGKFFHKHNQFSPTAPSPYDQGYADGYDKGYQAGFSSCSNGDGGDE